jgi:hypothetical protein
MVDMDPGRNLPSRTDRTRPPRPRGRWWLVAVVAAVVALAAAGWAVTRTDPTPAGATAAAVTTTTLPQACADALALADLLASHVDPLAGAVNDHADLMERLDLFLEGKPGGLSGHQVYEQGEKQMEVFEEHGPDAQVQVKRYQKVRKACPLG